MPVISNAGKQLTRAFMAHHRPEKLNEVDRIIRINKEVGPGETEYDGDLILGQ